MTQNQNLQQKRGIEILHDPTLNKSTTFTEAEREALGIVGLVPDVTEPEAFSYAGFCCSSDTKAPTSVATFTS